MSMYTRSVRIDVTPGAEPKVIHASQYDKNSRTYTVELYASGAGFELPAGAEVSIIGTKPDGNGFDIPVTVDDGTITFGLDEQMTPVAGRVPCKLVIAKSGEELLTERFILSVDRTTLDLDTLTSDSKIRQVAEIAADFDAIIAAADSIGGTAEAATQAAKDARNAKEAAEGARDAAQEAQRKAEAAQGEIEDADISGKIDQINAAVSDGVGYVNSARQNAVETVDSKVQEVARLKVNAEAVATQALSKANNLENEFAEVEQKTLALQQAVTRMQALINNKADDGFADSQGYLHLTANGEDISGGIGPFATNGSGGGSGGGGGETTNAVFDAHNVSGWISIPVPKGEACLVQIEWSSIEDEMETGNGRFTVQVGTTKYPPLEVPQGIVTVDISKYLPVGDSTVTITIADVYGQSRRFVVSVSVIEAGLASTFDTAQKYEGPFQFPITPTGAISKTIYLEIDGKLQETMTTSVSNRQVTFTIPQQSHGAHSITCYFTAEVDGKEIRSNTLYYEFIAIEPLNNTPIITSNFNKTEGKQYEKLLPDYMVYVADSMEAEIELIKDGEVASKQTVDRSAQVWALNFDTPGGHTFAIRCGSVTKTFSIEIEETSIDVRAETDQLALHLTAEGRSNNEANPATWRSGPISAALTGFNFVRDGWQTTEDGSTALRVSGDARVTIPYKIFGSDFRTSGKTIEVEMASRNVLDYNAVILSCMSGGRGLQMTAQRAELKSEQSEIYTQYKEDEHIRLAFTVEKRSENRLVFVYVNGCASGVIQYPEDDDFSQQVPADISIGSNDCTIDIYAIRVYDNDLTRHQVLDNWIADAQNGEELVERYTRNNVYDEYGNVVISKLPADLPYMIIECEELPQYKGDKKIVYGSYTDPANPTKSFAFTGCQINVQGTSSAPYARKNYDMQFKAGFELAMSGHADEYALSDAVVPFNRFVLKADVASSESANNTLLVGLYNDACPYRIPEMQEDSRVRWGIYGFPIVVFWHDTVSDTITLLGKYNFNHPKRFPAGYGYAV